MELPWFPPFPTLTSWSIIILESGRSTEGADCLESIRNNLNTNVLTVFFCRTEVPPWHFHTYECWTESQAFQPLNAHVMGKVWSGTWWKWKLCQIHLTQNCNNACETTEYFPLHLGRQLGVWKIIRIEGCCNIRSQLCEAPCRTTSGRSLSKASKRYVTAFRAS